MYFMHFHTFKFLLNVQQIRSLVLRQFNIWLTVKNCNKKNDRGDFVLVEIRMIYLS